MSLDDFEELLADKPADEWEPIGGRVLRMMMGAMGEIVGFEMPLSEIYPNVMAF